MPSQLLSVVLLLSAFLVTTGTQAQEPANPSAADLPLIQFSADATEPVIEYRIIQHMLLEQEPNPEPLLRIYGNGRVHAHFPVYMKNAGDYEYQLSRSELNALLRSLSQDGVIDFDHAVVKAERKQLEDQQRAAGVLHHISDTTETIIDIRLDEYQRHPDTNRIRNLNKRFQWNNLQHDKKRFPQMSAINGAATSAQRLHELLDHPDMQRIK
jgi:hypothetical protein